MDDEYFFDVCKGRDLLTEDVLRWGRVNLEYALNRERFDVKAQAERVIAHTSEGQTVNDYVNTD